MKYHNYKLHTRQFPCGKIDENEMNEQMVPMKESEQTNHIYTVKFIFFLPIYVAGTALSTFLGFFSMRIKKSSNRINNTKYITDELDKLEEPQAMDNGIFKGTK